MPGSTARPATEGTGRYGALLNSFLWLSDSETMTDDAIGDMRRSYAADISVIDHAVGLMVDALARKGMLEDTWIIYTSDHGEMAGSHGLMSKCVMYEPAVRVPLIIRPPGGRSGHGDRLTGRTARRPGNGTATSPARPSLEKSEGRSLAASVREGTAGHPHGRGQRELGLRRLRDRPLQARGRRGRLLPLPALRPRGGPLRGHEPRRGPAMPRTSSRRSWTPMSVRSSAPRRPGRTRASSPAGTTASRRAGLPEAGRAGRDAGAHECQSSSPRRSARPGPADVSVVP